MSHVFAIIECCPPFVHDENKNFKRKNENKEERRMLVPVVPLVMWAREIWDHGSWWPSFASLRHFFTFGALVCTLCNTWFVCAATKWVLSGRFFVNVLGSFLWTVRRAIDVMCMVLHTILCFLVLWLRVLCRRIYAEETGTVTLPGGLYIDVPMQDEEEDDEEADWRRYLEWQRQLRNVRKSLYVLLWPRAQRSEAARQFEKLSSPTTTAVLGALDTSTPFARWAARMADGIGSQTRWHLGLFKQKDSSEVSLRLAISKGYFRRPRDLAIGAWEPGWILAVKLLPILTSLSSASPVLASGSDYKAIRVYLGQCLADKLSEPRLRLNARSRVIPEVWQSILDFV